MLATVDVFKRIVLASAAKASLLNTSLRAECGGVVERFEQERARISALCREAGEPAVCRLKIRHQHVDGGTHSLRWLFVEEIFEGKTWTSAVSKRQGSLGYPLERLRSKVTPAFRELVESAEIEARKLRSSNRLLVKLRALSRIASESPKKASETSHLASHNLLPNGSQPSESV